MRRRCWKAKRSVGRKLGPALGEAWNSLCKLCRPVLAWSPDGLRYGVVVRGRVRVTGREGDGDRGKKHYSRAVYGSCGSETQRGMGWNRMGWDAARFVLHAQKSHPSPSQVLSWGYIVAVGVWYHHGQGGSTGPRSAPSCGPVLLAMLSCAGLLLLLACRGRGRGRL